MASAPSLCCIKKGARKSIDRGPRINDRIRAREVRVIGSSGEQLGVMPVAEALAKAGEANLDLVEVAPTATPPVCRIVDFGKYKYEQAKKEREAHKKSKTSDLKGMRNALSKLDAQGNPTAVAAAVEFVLEGLHLSRRLNKDKSHGVVRYRR